MVRLITTSYSNCGMVDSFQETVRGDQVVMHLRADVHKSSVKPGQPYGFGQPCLSRISRLACLVVSRVGVVYRIPAAGEYRRKAGTPRFADVNPGWSLPGGEYRLRDLELTGVRKA
jgi:hypothetical protein